jgi:3-isopropylmalate dehydrogenase
MTRYTISMIRGDGVGPELVHSANLLLEAISDNSDTKFSFDIVDAGDSSISRFGQAMPDQVLDIIRKSDACLKGPVGESAADVVLVLRQSMDLYANVRPVKSFKGTFGCYRSCDNQGKYGGSVPGLGIRC